MTSAAARPDADEVLDVVRAALARVLEIDAAGIHRDTSFRDDLAADSLALVEVVELVEEQLAARASRPFHIDDEDLDGFRTVGDAVDYAVARL